MIVDSRSEKFNWLLQGCSRSCEAKRPGDGGDCTSVCLKSWRSSHISTPRPGYLRKGDSRGDGKQALGVNCHWDSMIDRVNCRILAIAAGSARMHLPRMVKTCARICTSRRAGASSELSPHPIESHPDFSPDFRSLLVFSANPPSLSSAGTATNLSGRM